MTWRSGPAACLAAVALLGCGDEPAGDGGAAGPAPGRACTEIGCQSGVGFDLDVPTR